MSIKELEKKLNDDINRFKMFESLALDIEPIIDNFKDKQLNKRLATAIESKHPGLIVHWESREDYLGGKEFTFSIWGNYKDNVIKFDDRFNIYYFNDIDSLKVDLNRYIEARNDVMQGVLNQKRYELKNLKRIEQKVLEVQKELQDLTSSLTDKKRDFGKISYKLKDYINSNVTV